MSSPEANQLQPAGGTPEDDAILLAVFREEIQDLKTKERGTVNLSGVNPDELTAEDMRMWEAVSRYSVAKVPQDTFGAYRTAARSSGNKSRADFAGFLANKLSALVAWGNLHDLHE